MQGLMRQRRSALTSAASMNVFNALPSESRAQARRRGSTALSSLQLFQQTVKTTRKQKLAVFFGFEHSHDGVTHVMNPNSPFQTCWSIINFCLLLYIAIVLPVKTAWESEIGCIWGMIYFDIIIDIYFLLDIVVNALTGYQTIGRVETAWPKTFYRYLKTWFLFDIVVSTPTTLIQYSLDLVCGALVDSLRAVRFLRMLRLFRVVRVVKMFNLPIFQRIKTHHFLYSLCKLTLFEVFLMHLTACIWWFVKTYDPLLTEWEQKVGVFDQPVRDKYILSLYFAATTLVTVGFGEVSVNSVLERGYMFVLMLLGAGVFATIVSSISSLVDVSTRSKREREEQVRSLLEFFQFHQVPNRIQQKITHYYRHNNQVDEYKINMSLLVNSLPASLADDLRIELVQRVVGSTGGIFAGASEDYFKSLFEYLHPLRLCPDEIVFEKGDRAHSVFFVYQGSVLVTLADGTRIVVAEGNFNILGETVVTHDAERREYSAASSSYSILYYLYKKDIEKLNLEFPSVRASMKKFVSYVGKISVLNKEETVPENSKWLDMQRDVPQVTPLSQGESATVIQLWWARRKKVVADRRGIEIDIRTAKMAATKKSFGRNFLQFLKRQIEIERERKSFTPEKTPCDGEAAAGNDKFELDGNECVKSGLTREPSLGVLEELRQTIGSLLAGLHSMDLIQTVSAVDAIAGVHDAKSETSQSLKVVAESAVSAGQRLQSLLDSLCHRYEPSSPSSKISVSSVSGSLLSFATVPESTTYVGSTIKYGAFYGIEE